MAQLFDAAQTCLVARYFVRLGHAPWGIQQNLDRDDMLRLNDALATVLVLMSVDAVAQRFDHCERVVLTLLDDARRLLNMQARAANMQVSTLVADYFTKLQLRDAAVQLEAGPPSS